MDGSDANKQMSQKMKADKIMPSGLAISTSLVLMPNLN